MSDERQNHKLIFRFYSELFDRELTETLWGLEVDPNQGLYQIDSIPHFIPLVATEDIVRATYDPMEEGLLFKEVVTPSGNSTVQVIRQNENTPLLDLRKQFAELGCISVEVNEDFFVMEIPVNVNYAVVKEKLDELENQGEIEYGEPCLSEVHREQTH